MRISKVAILSALYALGYSIPLHAQGSIPSHPKHIDYPKLNYTLPSASDFRTVLSNGMVVYIAEDKLFPTFDLSVTLRVASSLDPNNKRSLASLMGSQMRDGGTERYSPEAFDEEIDFLAASLSCNIGDTRGRARLSCLSKDIDAGLALLNQMLQHPRFDGERLEKARDRLIQNIKRRNDSTNTISRIEWGMLLFGKDHYSNAYPSSETVRAVQRQDLFLFHKRYIHPGNMILAVSGDFDRQKMLRKLEDTFANWPVGETGPTSFSAAKSKPTPGVYMVHKPGVNQGRVSIGHRSIARGSPDEFPLQIMNGILGAGGFRSRLFAKIRSDEGLAYNTGSRFNQGIYHPEDFVCWFQSKNNSCAYAASIVLDEISRLREERVTNSDVEDTIAYYVESFPQRFPNKMALLRTFVSDEYTGRNPKYWQTYLDRLKQVTPDDVLRVANKYLHPDELVILAVGDTQAIMKGGHDKAPNLRFDAFGNVMSLGLRDPDTLRR